MGFPVVAPPGVPAYRVAALRRGFGATMVDPTFRRDAEKRGLAIQPSSGDDVAKVVEALIATPKDVIATLKRSIDDARSDAKVVK
jgi:tripartite-type tricarboxylate transporter receptor subunit TctC